MIEFKYRPDVDGLRAVAITLVLLFHAGFGCRGGYVGVDVFFVISGFLITGLILKEQESGSFRLRHFWLRRIRRILPAVTVNVVAVLVVGFFVLIPNDYADLGESVIAQQLMISNFYFWRDTGYFAGPADLKPLLHTWSLAVEEQFYLGYPFLLVFLNRFRRQVGVAALVVIAAASFAASQYGVEHHPETAFFLLPSRAWELLLGGLIWFMPPPVRLKPWLGDLLSWLSLGGIIAAGSAFTSATPFPGAHALLPCCSTATLIYLNSTRLSRPSSVLATRPVVFLGLISYSLYLWHWPILVFMRYSLGQELGFLPRVLALVVSFGMACLSWRFIETPFRKKAWIEDNRVLVGTAMALSFVVIGLAFVVLKYDGLPLRFGSDTENIFATMENRGARRIVSESEVRRNELPRFGAVHSRPRLLIWGDSHAMCLVPAIDVVCKRQGIGGVQATHGGTLPLIGWCSAREWSASTTFNDAVLEYVTRNKIEVVVLAGYWCRDAEDQEFAACYQATAGELLKLGCTVVVVRDNPIQKESPSKAVVRALRSGQKLGELGVSMQEHRETQAAADEALMNVKHERLIVLDPAPFLADEAGYCRIVMGGAALYVDRSHLSIAGARRLVPMFEHAINKALDRNDVTVMSQARLPVTAGQ